MVDNLCVDCGELIEDAERTELERCSECANLNVVSTQLWVNSLSKELIRVRDEVRLWENI